VPPLPDVPNVIKAIMKFTLGEDTDVVNILHFEFTGTATSGDLDAFALQLSDQFHTQFSGHLTSDLEITEVECIDLTSTSSATGLDTTGRTFTGTGPPLTGETAIVVSHHISRRYRGGKPRTYIAGALAGDLTDEQLWDSANVAIWQGDWDDFINNVLTTYGALTVDNLVNVSYYSGFTVVINPITGRARNVPTLRVGGPVIDGVNSSSINPRPGSQRRRSLQGR
jgi:hypothetical protein